MKSQGLAIAWLLRIREDLGAQQVQISGFYQRITDTFAWIVATCQTHTLALLSSAGSDALNHTCVVLPDIFVHFAVL